MAGSYRSNEKRYRLLGELLANIEPLGGSHRHVRAAMMLYLFAVDLSPLRLVTD
jgi:hypothetical protein